MIRISSQIRCWCGNLTCKGQTEAKPINITVPLKVFYFGIEVEIVSQMSHCSLIRFQDRGIVVDTADLLLEHHSKEPAKRTNIAWVA